MTQISFDAYEYVAYPPGAPIGRQKRRLREDVAQAALLVVNVYALLLPVTDPHRQNLAELYGEQEVRRREQIASQRLLPVLTAAPRVGMPVVYAADSAPRIAFSESRFAEVQRTHLGLDPVAIFAEDCNDPQEYCHADPPLIAYAPSLTPQPGDHYVRKWVYSAFYGTWLDRLFRNLGTRTLFCAGFNGDSDLWCTALDGHWLGYRIVLLSDAFAAVDIPQAEPVAPFTERLIHYAENCLGYSCETGELLAACEAAL
jgi:nicotinamidase-related amidase